MTAATQIKHVPTAQPLDTVSRLREEAAKSSALNSVCHVFAMRERSRAQVTLNSLMATMVKEGFDYKRDEYVRALKTLAAIGIGTASFAKNNRFKALTNVKYTLQSVGMAAISKKNELDRAIPSNKFTRLTVDAPAKAAKEPPVSAGQKYPAELTVRFSKDEVSTFKLPGGISAKELGNILTDLYNTK